MSSNSPWRSIDGELDGIRVRHEMRQGDRPILMVHGIGPGTTGRLNFAPLLERLAPDLALHLIDLVGFGASGRKPGPPFFDVGLWLRQIGQAIDKIQDLHRCAPLLIGNSVGGALALKMAALRADLDQVLVIAAPAAPPAPTALRSFWSAPLDLKALARAMAPMTAAEAEPSPEHVAARFQPFRSGEYAAYFNTMLADPDACLQAVALQQQEAARIKARVSILHGRSDRACPVAVSKAALFPMIPDARITVLGECGHNIISERTADVVAVIKNLVEKVEPQ